MRHPQLSALKTKVDPDTHDFTIRRGATIVAQGRLGSDDGNQTIESFFADHMADGLSGPPRLVHAPGHSFSDVPVKCLHILNLASVRALERAMDRVIDPLRFRANVIVDLPVPWIENSWVDKKVTLAQATLDVLEPTGRCDATNAAPGKGIRDMDIPTALEQEFGHRSMGVYATVGTAGRVAIGDKIEEMALGVRQ